MKTQLIITTSFESIHCYPSAPEAVAFLRHPHRHTFEVRATLNTSADREKEFFLVKMELDELIVQLKQGDVSTWSCERWATEILRGAGLCECEVWEETVAGARVFADA